MFKFCFKWGLISLILGTTLLGLVLLFYCYDLPKLSDLEKEKDQNSIQINYANGDLLINLRGDKASATEISYYELPKYLINAVIATEDRRFFSHFGIDIFGILRAYHINKKAGKIIQGGSTITQQLAKMLFLNSERTLKRKIQEALLAIQLERKFSKEQILTFYLNRAYFGSGSYGISNAAKEYFGKDVAQLNLNESALLAGVLKAPSKISPKNNRQLAEKRANVVLKAMIESGFLQDEDIAELDSNPNYQNNSGQKFYFSDLVQSQFREFLNKKDNEEKTLIISTTLNKNNQENLEKVLNSFIEKNAKKLGKSEIAVVVMSKKGELLAIAGGKDYQQSQFNRAVFSKRQAGSAFKTFVYLAAFEDSSGNFRPDSTIEDKKINIGTWLPENYEGSYLGEVTLQQAFAKSLNSVAIQLTQKIGIESVAKMARLCGIVSPIKKNDLTIALGTTEVSLYELTSAYATIANEGIPVVPFFIDQIKNDQGKALYQRNSSGLDAVISKDAENYIKKLLHEVVTSGTGKGANINDKIYGKTGTSQNFRDAWFLGFDDDKVIGVWIGNDDNLPTNKITGGSLPASLFAQIAQKI